MCNACAWLARPEDLRNAKACAASNKRRAIRNAAEVFGPVPAHVYEALKAEGTCVYCGAPSAEVDHVRALVHGGWEHESNLVPACTRCNRSKGPKLLTDWDPIRVEHGALCSPKVAGELARLIAA